MFEQTIDVSESPRVTARECLGSLTVRGGAGQQITLTVRDGDDEVELEHEGDAVSFSAAGDCTLICPAETSLTVERLMGNLRVDGVKGPLKTGVIHGNVTLRAVAEVSLDETLGNLSAHDVAGNLEAREVKGNARVGAVDGRLALVEVGGNLKAEGLKGGLEAETVRGNAKLGPPFSPGLTYRAKAKGNLTVYVPAHASLRVAARARGKVRSSVVGLDLGRENGQFTGTLGTGEAALDLEAMGNLSLRPVGEAEPSEPSFDLDDLGAQIEWQVNQALAEMTTRLESRLGTVDTESIKRRIDQATERARRQAERAAEQARLRAERAERRWKRASGQRSPAAEAATDEERLRVLRMVEDGKITPEQASELLAVLEGE